MSGLANQTWTIWLAGWGATLSTLLGGVKVWETFWRDRIRLATSYRLNSYEGIPDEIVVTNLSSQTVQVSGWELAWTPRRCAHVKAIEVTPDEGAGAFTLAPKSAHTLTFEEQDKLPWGGDVSNQRQLCLTLHFFDRRSKLLVVC